MKFGEIWGAGWARGGRVRSNPYKKQTQKSVTGGVFVQNSGVFV